MVVALDDLRRRADVWKAGHQLFGGEAEGELKTMKNMDKPVAMISRRSRAFHELDDFNLPRPHHQELVACLSNNGTAAQIAKSDDHTHTHTRSRACEGKGECRGRGGTSR